MDILTPKQCSSWLEATGLPESPYPRTPEGFLYVRFLAPRHGHHAEGLSRILVDECGDQPWLLQVMDWSRPAEAEPPLALREVENRAPGQTFERTGILFQTSELEEARLSCAFVVSSGMSAYMYCPHTRLTVYLWEGEFIELWSPSKRALEDLTHALSNQGVEIAAKSDDENFA